MRFSVAIPTCKEGLSYPLPFAGPEEIVRVAQSAEQLGYHSVWGNDHITAPRYVRETFDQPPNFYEPLIVLAYIAASTRRIKLAPSVIVLPMREPVYLAKQVATLDVFSGGRFILGVGVGAYREEFEAIHPDLAPTAQRGQMVDESLEALVRLFREPVASFAGDYYHFEGIALAPKPLQDPLPLYVGGNNLNAARRAGRWGTGWLPAALEPERIRQGVEVARQAAVEAGRGEIEIDIAPQLMVRIDQTAEKALARFEASQMYRHLHSLSKSTLRQQEIARIAENNLIGTPEQILARIERLAGAGVTHCAAMNFISETPADMLEQMAWFHEEVGSRYPES